MADVDFFKKDSLHGLVKRIVYKKYLQAYVPKFLYKKAYSSSSDNCLTIFDGFAGAGKYGSGWPEEIERYGSPVIALRVAIDFYSQALKLPTFFLTTTEAISRSRTIASIGLDNIVTSTEDIVTLPMFENYAIKLIFVECYAARFKRLVNTLLRVANMYNLNVSFRVRSSSCTIDINFDNIEGPRPYAEYAFLLLGLKPIVCHVICSEFTRVSAPSDPGVTFLDPCGYSQVPMYRVKEFAGQSRDVLINLMSSYVNRFVTQTPGAIAELFGLQTTTEDIVSALRRMAIDNEPEAVDERTDIDGISSCVKTYENRLKRETGCRHILTFEMRGESNQRIYHLIFASNDVWRSLSSIKEAFNRCTQFEGLFQLSEYFVLRKGRPLSLSNDQDDKVIAHDIFRKFRGRQYVPINDIEQYIWIETPYIFRKGPIKILEKDGRINQVTPLRKSDGKRRRAYTYPKGTLWQFCFKTE